MRESIRIAAVLLVLHLARSISASPLQDIQYMERHQDTGETHHHVSPVPAGSVEYYLRLVMCAVLVLVGGLLAGLTLGLMSLDEMNLQILATSGTPLQQHYAQCIQPLRKNGHWLLVTLLLGNTVVNETLPIIMDSVFGGGGVTAIVVSTVSIVLFGEIIPQSLCARYGLAIGAFFAYPVRILQYILSPLGYPIALLLDYILGSDHGAIYKKAQLKELVSLSDAAHGGNLSADEVTIIRGALDLSEKLVVDVMTDLCNVFMVALDARLDRRLLTEMLRRGHSRVPVYNGRREDIVGVLLVKSLILLDPDDAVPVRDVCIAPIPLVTTTTSLYEILNAFQEGGSHMAVVMGPPSAAGAPAENSGISAGSLCTRPHLGLDALSSSSSEDTLAESTPLLLFDGQKTPPLPNYIVSDAAPDDSALASYVPIGIITLEDVIEELIQEEIIDETDEFVDIRRKIKVVRATSQMSGADLLLCRQLSRGMAFSARRRLKVHHLQADGGSNSNSSAQYGARPQSVPSSLLSEHAFMQNEHINNWSTHTPRSYTSEVLPCTDARHFPPASQNSM